METIYYSLDAKRLTVCAGAAGRRASGGQETVCYAFVPQTRPQRRRAPGKLVRLEDYRPGAAAARDGRGEAGEAPDQPRQERARGGRGLRLGLALDLIATAAIVCVAAAVAVGFLFS